MFRDINPSEMPEEYLTKILTYYNLTKEDACIIASTIMLITELKYPKTLNVMSEKIQKIYNN